MRRRGWGAQLHSSRPRAHFSQFSRESDVVNTAVILCYSWQYSVTAVPVGTLTVCWCLVCLGLMNIFLLYLSLPSLFLKCYLDIKSSVT